MYITFIHIFYISRKVKLRSNRKYSKYNLRKYNRFKPLKIKISLSYVLNFSSYRAVSTAPPGCKSY